MRRTLSRNSYLSALLLAVCAAAASGAVYTWSGLASGNSDYTDHDNWCDRLTCVSGYPDGTDDDAIFPVRPGVNGPWGDVDLDFDGTTQIRDMTIKAGVHFKGHSGEPHLKTATLTIDATSDEVTITFNGKISLTAH